MIRRMMMMTTTVMMTDKYHLLNVYCTPAPPGTLCIMSYLFIIYYNVLKLTFIESQISLSMLLYLNALFH